MMKTNLKLHLLLLTLLSLAGFAHAQGTAINYQGRLNDGSLPATGLYDFTFAVFDVQVGGAALAGPDVYNAEPVTNGLFNVSLDFGPGIFTGPARWLEITVRTNGVSDPMVLTPRTPLLPTPYAIFADKAGAVASGTLTAEQLNSGGVPPAPGQFLTYDGGNFLWRDPVVDGVWSVLNNNAYHDAGKVGIGTMTPANKLTVHTPTLEYGIEHTDGDIRLGTFVGRATGYLGTLSNHKLTFFANDNGLENMTMTLIPGGNVGIGTSGPLTPLEVIGIVRSTRINGLPQYIQLNGGDSGSIKLTAQSNLDAEKNLFIENLSGQATPGPNNNMQFVLGTTAARSTKMTISKEGFVGIGTAAPQDKLHLYDPERSVSHRIETGGFDNSWSRVEFANANGQWNVGTSRSFNSDQFFIHRQGEPISFAIETNGNAFLHGTMSCKVLTIRGGADVAEPFTMPEEIAKGSVVVIDDAHPGQLKLSTEAYDTRVAGIVSGANGINPGIALQQEGVVEGGQNVALSGRVYVQADAAFGAIKPGDLLTTSDTRGHAMKVTEHGKAQGAILGKAMSGLKDGKGMVLVLVTLQ
jgi:hypothetical protein